MSGRISVIHLTYREGLSSVFPAQVTRPMSLIQKRGYDVTLTVFAALGEFVRSAPRHRWAAQLDQARRDFGLEIRRLPSPPSRAPRLWDDSVAFRRWLRDHMHAPPRTLIHCRGANATLIAHRATRGMRKVPIVFDCRGMDAPEYLLVNGYERLADAPPDIRREAQRRESRQRHATDVSQGVICVSEAMKQRIQHDWSVPADKVLVVPCCTEVESEAIVNSRRNEIRSQLGLDGCLVLVYCGSLAPWQMAGPTLEIARAILSCRPDTHFLAVTSNLRGMTALADQYGIEPKLRTLVSATHDQVSSYLAAGDVGLLIRSRSDVNAVASPVKFAEYLANGLTVILTEGVGDYSGLARQTNVGCVVPDLPFNDHTKTMLADFFDSFEAEPQEARRRSMGIARKRLDWCRKIEEIRTFYERVLRRECAPIESPQWDPQ